MERNFLQKLNELHFTPFSHSLVITPPVKSKKYLLSIYWVSACLWHWALIFTAVIGDGNIFS